MLTNIRSDLGHDVRIKVSESTIAHVHLIEKNFFCNSNCFCHKQANLLASPQDQDLLNTAGYTIVQGELADDSQSSVMTIR